MIAVVIIGLLLTYTHTQTNTRTAGTHDIDINDQIILIRFLEFLQMHFVRARARVFILSLLPKHIPTY